MMLLPALRSALHYILEAAQDPINEKHCVLVQDQIAHDQSLSPLHFVPNGYAKLSVLFARWPSYLVGREENTEI
jgi:hypothetical protein